MFATPRRPACRDDRREPSRGLGVIRSVCQRFLSLHVIVGDHPCSLWFLSGDGTPVTILEHSVCYNDEDAFQEANAAWHTSGGSTMTIRELIPRLQAMDPEGGVFVVVVKADGIHELFDVQEVRDENGNAQIEVQEHLTHR
jgi:hypothetical protein